MAENRLTDLAPELPEGVKTKLAKAKEWNRIDQYTHERDVFNRSYENIASLYYGSALNRGGNAAGAAMLSVFSEYKPVVDQFVRFNLKNEDVFGGDPLNAKLVGDIARGGDQAFIRPLVIRSFGTANAAYSHTPSSTGDYDLLPTGTGTLTATSAKQAWIVLGYMEPYAGGEIPYDEIQAQPNDAEGVRRPDYPRHTMIMQGGGNLRVYKRPTPLLIETGMTIDINVNVRTANVEFGLWPIGIEVLTRDASEAVGTMD